MQFGIDDMWSFLV